MVKEKRPEVTHNATKIKVLCFLDLKDKAKNAAPTAGEIARVIGGDPRSLYVLLARWWRWQLIDRLNTTPYRYRIADEGRRYLGKTPDWFFPGYYSKKRKCRIPAYRGKLEDMYADIATRARAIVLAPNKDKTEVYCFEAPFSKASNFRRMPLDEDKSIQLDETRSIIVKAEDIIDAYHALQGWGCFKNIDPMGQAIIDAGLAQWKKYK